MRMTQGGGRHSRRPASSKRDWHRRPVALQIVVVKSSCLGDRKQLAVDNQSIEMTCGEQARWAIVQEATAIKAGNVHPKARFEDMDYAAMIVAGEAIGKAIDRGVDSTLGPLVLECTLAMLDAVGTNTSLGTILLLAPLIRCERLHGRKILTDMLLEDACGDPVRRALAETTATDCACIYRAIAASKPGGMGVSDTMDVLGPPPDSIVAAMCLAAPYDDVARQYCHGYPEVVRYAKLLLSPEFLAMSLTDAIRYLQVVILSERVDSLIARKCGPSVGLEVQSMATSLLQSSHYGSEFFEMRWQALDTFLRCDGHRRNPGTTADLIAAALFMASPERIGFGRQGQ
jgi:triphosphoribosyl-dephospho-CoA synthase